MDDLDVFDVFDVRFFHLYKSQLFNNLFLDAFDWHNVRSMDSFNHNFVDGDLDDSVLDNWYLNLSLNCLDYFNCILNENVLNSLYFSYFDSLDYFFNDDFDFLDLRD